MPPKPKSAGKAVLASKPKSSASAGPVVLYWFRTDLRLTDSPALARALSLQPATFYPVWCWDPHYIYGHRVGLNRWSFLLESMSSLSAELASLNPTQRLHVVRGNPERVLPLMWKQWGVTHVVWEKDSNAYARERDARVREQAREMGVEVVEVHGRHLFDPEMVVKVNGGKPTMTLHQWQTVTANIGEVGAVVPTPESLPDPGDVLLQEEDGVEPFKWEGVDLNAGIRTGEDTCFDTLIGPENDYAVPTLASMGYPPSTTSIRGGTTVAHTCLANFLSDSLAVATFSKPHTAPTSLEPSTTLLSPYLKFGCVGVREVWWGSKDVVDKWKKQGGKSGKETKEPENMFGQLQFRDMYAAAEVGVGADFQRIRGNKVCRYIDWKLSNEYDADGHEIIPRPRGEEEDEERLLAWKEGRTGFPWIDACMRQLKHEGWIHHLARHSVACFITRGQCYISWERGMEVFDEWLIDWDPASNPGNWMWLSCSAFFSQYYRVYGLESWPSKTDKTGALVRKYCPELRDFPDKYIYCPHKAPLDVQRKAKCVIGTDYPPPILDEHAEKDLCIARLKNAYALHLNGDAREVLDGSARDMLRKKHEETGAVRAEVKSEKEKMDERGRKRREREGNTSLDGHFKRVKKEEDGEGEEDGENGDGVKEEERDGEEVKETVQGDSDMGDVRDKAEQGDVGRKRRGAEKVEKGQGTNGSGKGRGRGRGK